MTIPPFAPPASGLPKPHRPDLATLRDQSRKLEAAFLSEMLAHAGVAGSGGSFGGGSGEEQFQSFLRDALAERMAQRGGIGLAERLFEAMKGRLDGA